MTIVIARGVDGLKNRNVYGNVEREIEECGNALRDVDLDLDFGREIDNTPTHGDELGEVDSSVAMVIDVDACGMKQTDPLRYDNLVNFVFYCRQKRYLSWLSHPGNGRKGGGLIADDGPGLDDDDWFSFFGSQAVEQYNNLLTKYGKAQGFKLKLLNLIKVNELDGSGFFYLTFTAQDEITGTIERYQAAVLGHMDNAEKFQVSCILGLFRRDNDDKVLALISVKGGEEYYADKVRYSDALLKQKAQMNQTAG